MLTFICFLEFWDSIKLTLIYIGTSYNPFLIDHLISDSLQISGHRFEILLSLFSRNSAIEFPILLRVTYAINSNVVGYSVFPSC